MRYAEIYNSKGILKELGKRIKQYRISYPMTQKELADETGISLRSISRLETGEDIQVSNLVKILEALELKNNLELLVPDPEMRPSYYVMEEKKRYRAGKKTTAHANTDSADSTDVESNGSVSGWKWGDEL